jgi:hypothetical protein
MRKLSISEVSEICYVADSEFCKSISLKNDFSSWDNLPEYKKEFLNYFIEAMIIRSPGMNYRNYSNFQKNDLNLLAALSNNNVYLNKDFDLLTSEEKYRVYLFVSLATSLYQITFDRDNIPSLNDALRSIWRDTCFMLSNCMKENCPVEMKNHPIIKNEEEVTFFNEKSIELYNNTETSRNLTVMYNLFKSGEKINKDFNLSSVLFVIALHALKNSISRFVCIIIQ